MQKAGRVAKVQHLASVPYAEVPAFLAKLRAWKGRTARSQITVAVLEWLILTAARFGEVRGATHEEFDWGARTWTIPAGRMKAAREHVVPISEAAERVWQDIVWRSGGAIGNGKLFPVSEEAVLRLAKKIVPGVTLHGFRSSFRDWCAENGVPRDIAEAALSHTNGNRTEKAYNRTALVEQRRAVMERWAAFAYGS
jgi:integrase